MVATNGMVGTIGTKERELSIVSPELPPEGFARRVGTIEIFCRGVAVSLRIMGVIFTRNRGYLYA